MIGLALERSKDLRLQWNVRCDCGTTRIVRGSSLSSGNTSSCGCLKREQATKNLPPKTHGHTGSSEYSTWRTMIARCSNAKATGFARYGGSGIRVCQRWQHSFEEFLKDMGPRPEGMTLERKDNTKGYSPDNCIWATWFVQANNRRGNVRITHDGRTLSAAEWAQKFGINEYTIRSRLRNGWTTKDALTKHVVDNSLIIYEGRALSMNKWAQEVGIPIGTLRRRVELGWTTKDALMRKIEKVRIAAGITYEGRTLSRDEWAQELGMSRSTIYARLAAGWTIKDTLTKPSRKRRSLEVP